MSSETEKILDEAAGIIEVIGGGGGAARRPQGGGRYLLLPSSPNLVTRQLTWESFRRITGFFASSAVNIAITKNGMTVAAGGNLADSAGNAFAAPLDVAAGMIIFVGTVANTEPKLGLNFPVYVGETLYVSKNQAANVFIEVYFDYE